MKSDFHMHSSYSDGLYSPEEVLLEVRKAGVTHFALTDHDTNHGIAEMEHLTASEGMPVFLPGAEISCGGNGRTHMLVYGKVCTPFLTQWLDDSSSARAGRALEIISLLRKNGVSLSEAAVERLSHGNVCRPHIAHEMIAEGFVQNQKQAFDRYLGEGKCCFVPHKRKAAAELLDELQGQPLIPVLAHPFKIGLGEESAVLSFVESLIPHGLRGVEVYHPSANARQCRTLEGFARSKGMLVTGGSDFHGEGEGHAAPGQTGASWPQMEKDTLALLEAVQML